MPNALVSLVLKGIVGNFAGMSIDEVAKRVALCCLCVV
jgi:hypothetical protein